jgi:hypothetical protein
VIIYTFEEDEPPLLLKFNLQKYCREDMRPLSIEKRQSLEPVGKSPLKSILKGNQYQIFNEQRPIQWMVQSNSSDSVES